MERTALAADVRLIRAQARCDARFAALGSAACKRQKSDSWNIRGMIQHGTEKMPGLCDGLSSLGYEPAL